MYQVDMSDPYASVVDDIIDGFYEGVQSSLYERYGD